MDINDLSDGIMKSINQVADEIAEQRLQETGRGPENGGGGISGFLRKPAHQKCFTAKALPEPVFRYFSKRIALPWSAKAKDTSNCQG